MFTTNFKRFFLSVIALVFSVTFLFSQNFEKNNNVDLKGGYNGFSTFVDYNNDGFLDVFVTGVDFGDRFENAVLYKNNGDKTFSETDIKNIPRVIYGDCSWGDYDNNGTLDLLYSGTTSGFAEKNITKIYKNIDNGCEFKEINTTIPQLSRSNVDWVDVNNDGLLDIQYHGIDSTNNFVMGILKNNGDDTFTEVQNLGFYKIRGPRGNGTVNSAEWIDFDGDGLTDVVIAMASENERLVNIYKNLGDFKFQRTSVMPQLAYIQMDVGDFNNDNLPDIVLTGSYKNYLNSGDITANVVFIKNNGNMNFETSFFIENQGTFISDLKFGDINNDGFLDVINYGAGASFRTTKFYLNNKDGTFSDVNHSLPISLNGGVQFGDYDNDNDLDLLYYGRFTSPNEFESTNIFENLTINNTTPIDILFNETCDCNNEIDFSLNQDIESISWTFDDILSGASNISINKNATHVFSEPKTYQVAATYTKKGVTNTIFKNISVASIPTIKKPDNLTFCENSSGINFENSVNGKILEGLTATNYKISYHTSLSFANLGSWALPNDYKPIVNTQTIFARVESANNKSCFAITEFDINVTSPPIIKNIDDKVNCGSNGFSEFNLQNLESEILDGQNNLTVEFYDSNQNKITTLLTDNYTNIISNKDFIKAKVINSNLKNCFTETTINLIVNDNPKANTLSKLVACDSDNDGISEFFDTSEVETEVLGTQTGMMVSYFLENGVELSSPLPNPYTNSKKNEIITLRVTNPDTKCFSETTLQLETLEKPSIKKPEDIYSCDNGDGFSFFDTSNINNQIIGNQNGLNILFFDENNNQLPSPLPLMLENTTGYSQKINIIVEDTTNKSCFSETSFNLIVNTLPEINLDKEYTICDLEPNLSLELNQQLESYNWFDENGILISTAYNINIENEGNYSVTVTENKNNIICENTFYFKLKRSFLSKIEKVNHVFGENFIEIIATNDKNVEYSIDGVMYQQSNYFDNIKGGTYNVSLKDMEGCGIDFYEVVILDYPKFFTPNNDGKNDFWNIEGLDKYPNSEVFIYNRYGIMLKKLNSKSLGWDGLYQGNKLPRNDYWFRLNLNDGKSFSGHFSLIN
jgi:gliding motility-associated-like protein